MINWKKLMKKIMFKLRKLIRFSLRNRRLLKKAMTMFSEKNLKFIKIELIVKIVTELKWRKKSSWNVAICTAKNVLKIISNWGKELVPLAELNLTFTILNQFIGEKKKINNNEEIHQFIIIFKEIKKYISL